MIVYLVAVSCILGFICLITGTLNMILVCVVDPAKNPEATGDRTERLWLNLLLLSTGLLLLADVGAHTTEGSFDPAKWQLFRFCALMDHQLAFLSLFCFITYVSKMVKMTPEFRLIRNMVYAICGCLFLTAALSFRTGFIYTFDSRHFYQAGPGFRYALTIFVFAIFLAGFGVHTERMSLSSARRLTLHLYIILPILFMIQQKLCFIRMQTPNIGLGMAVLCQSIVWGVHRRQVIIDQQEELIRQQELLIRQEQKLTRMQIRSAVSQMRPHFVFNVLNTIYVLIDQDPETAKTAVSSFSDYLRGLISVMDTRHRIPFAQELEYIQKYLELEQIRYGEELRVVYDLQVMGFPVPPLSVQPLVENAVKHGVGIKPGGGTVTIRTEESGGKIRLTVHDDGVGFEPASVLPEETPGETMGEGIGESTGESTGEKGKDHGWEAGLSEEGGPEKTERPTGIGLRIARRRFRLVMDADFQVESAPGQGTTVTVIITPPEAQL